MKRSKAMLMLLMMMIIANISTAQTVDEVLKNYYKAVGGEKFAKVSTLKQEGNIVTSMGDLAFVKYSKRPNIVRTEINAMGQQILQLFDGNFSYSNNPFQGQPDLVKGSDEQTANSKLQADFESPLLNYKEKGTKVELVGKENVDAAETYKVKITTKDGFEEYYYISSKTNLPARMTYKNTLNGAENNNDVRYLSYKDVNGVMIPDDIKVMQDNNPMGKELNIKITSIESNVVIDDAMFAAPETK